MKRNRNTITLTVVIILRICVPFFIFRNPLIAFIFSLILDQADGQLFYNSGYRWEQYNKIDKVLDYWWYLFILIFLWGRSIFPIAAVLLAYRSIGQFLGIVYNKEEAYLWFPNILEWFFLAQLLFSEINIFVALTISVVWALLVEWGIHKSQAHILSKYIFHNEIVWKRNNRTRSS